MDCFFCQEFSFERTPHSRIIWESKDFLLLPTVGCITPGYCLLMPWEHAPSFAALSETEPVEGLRIAELFRKRIAEVFGSTIIAEHGSGGYGKSGASCCEHAHLHLIPIPGQVLEARTMYEDFGGPPIILTEASELKNFASLPYIFLSPEQGTYCVWLQTANFRQQFARWVAARLLGNEGQYDWRTFKFEENMRITKLQLERRILDIS